MINVKDYGAIGDGVVDDTIAIRTALLAALGGTLYIPQGVYLVKELSAPEVFLITKSIRIIGDGANIDGTWIKIDSTTPNTVDFFHIKPTQASSPFIQFHDLWISNENIDFIGGRDAIAIETDATTQVQRLDITNCWISAGAGYAISGKDTDVSVSTACYYQSTIEKNVLYGKKGGIHFTQAGDSITISDNAFPPIGDIGIFIEPVIGAAHQVIERNGFQGCLKGQIHLRNCNQAKIRDNQIEQGFGYTGATGGMVLLESCQGVEVTGNNMNSFNFVDNVRLAGNSTYNKISDNTLEVEGGQSHVIVNSTAGKFNVISPNNRFMVSYVAGAPKLIINSPKAQKGVLVQMALTGGWVGSGADHDGLFYIVNEDNSVAIHGNIRNGTNVAGTVIATLPPECAPKKISYITVWCTNNTNGILTVLTNGQIIISGTVLPQTSAVKLMNAQFQLT